MDLSEVAEELYGLPPEDFTARRDSLAAQARSSGERDLATTIKRLRRPSIGAWTLNRFVRRRPDEIATLLELGDSLREAQQSFSGEQLRELGRERQQILGLIAGQVKSDASDMGRPLTAAIEREIDATLEAALSDPDAGNALRSGRLVRGLSYAGFGTVDLTNAVGATAAEEPPHHDPDSSPQARRGAGDAAPDIENSGVSARNAEFERARVAAELAGAAARQADRRLVEAEGEVEVASRAAGAAGKDVEHTEAAAELARRRLDEARMALGAAQVAREVATEASTTANTAATEARHAFDLLARGRGAPAAG